MCVRTMSRGRREMSMPSMPMVPERRSSMRRRVSRVEDLPEPVRPQMATLEPAGMGRVRPVRAGGKEGE